MIASGVLAPDQMTSSYNILARSLAKFGLRSSKLYWSRAGGGRGEWKK